MCPLFFTVAEGAFSGLHGAGRRIGSGFFGKGKKSAEFFPPRETGGDEDFFSAKRGIGFWGAALRSEYFFVFLRKNFCFPQLAGIGAQKKSAKSGLFLRNFRALLGKLEVGTGLELNNLGSLDLDFGFRLGVDAHARFAFYYRESAEADETEHLVLLNAGGDGGENNIECRFGASLGSFLAEEFLDFKNEFCFIHIIFWIGCYKENLLRSFLEVERIMQIAEFNKLQIFIK